MEVPEELPLLAFSKREDPRDVLVLPEGIKELMNQTDWLFKSQTNSSAKRTVSEYEI